MNEKVNIVYFAYLNSDSWEPIVLEQLNSLKSLGLYDIADNIYISLSCQDEQLKRLKQLIWAKFKKIQIINHFKENLYEYPGLKAVYDVSQNDDSVILYFHTKGMTSGKKVDGNHELRRILFDYTINNYSSYLDNFKNNPNLDIGGIFPSEFGFVWYNFFWVRSKYVKEHLPKPEFTKHRYYWERWIGSEYSSKKNILTYSPLLNFNKLGNKAQLYQKKLQLINQYNTRKKI